MRLLSHLFCLRAALVFAVLISAAANATPPTNDVCSGAMVVPGTGPFPYLTSVIADITQATSAGDPVPPPTCVFTTNVTRGVWYKFTPAAAATYIFSVSYDTVTTVSDTVMALYSASGDCAGLSLIDCDDDQSGLRSGLAADLRAGTTYYVLVWAAYFDLSPGKAVQLRVSKPVTPANDLCPGAEVIPSSGPFPYLTAISDAWFASETGDPPKPSCANKVSRSLWYQFTPSTTTNYAISTCLDTATTIYDSVLAVYTSSSDCNGTMTEVACNDSADACAALTAVLSAGTTYYIVVWEFDLVTPTPGETSVQLRVSIPQVRFQPGA